MSSLSTSPFSLQGRRVLVTGASSGLGRATSVCLSELGATLVLVGRDSARLEETRALLSGDGHALQAFDLANVGEIPDWLLRVAEVTPLDGLVHSAGTILSNALKAMPLAAFEDLMRVNVTAAVALAQGFRNRRVHADDASIVFLSSVAGLVGQAGLVGYGASKAALAGLARGLAVELARDRIRVNCVAPGFVRSGMGMSNQLEARMTEGQLAALSQAHLLGFGAPEDVAHAVAFLLARSGRWITGTTLVVDGGFTAH
jgi:NAD(P)-dependent dehydrogenase (short-subunit alcohol dehydrogenase family)